MKKRLIAFLQRLSPSHAVKSWLIIDSIIVLWSILLLLELWDTLTPNLRLKGERAYLVYNFGTTLIWVIACDLHLLDHYIRYHSAKRRPQEGEEEEENNPETNALAHEPSQQEESESSEKEQQDVRFLIFEWIVAVYFLYDSLDVYKKWSNPDESVKAEVVDTFINLAPYAYHVIHVLLRAKDDYIELPPDLLADIAIDDSDLLLEHRGNDEVEKNTSSVPFAVV